jgi:hypothetical protein
MHTMSAASRASTMTDIGHLRTAVAGLIGLAATQEQQLLAVAPDREVGSPSCWAAVPLIAHNTEFRRQQVQRLTAIEGGQTPPEFGDVDHESAQLYATLAAGPKVTAGEQSWQVAGHLIAGVAALSAADLTDPARNPWLRGRQLWLQIVVRGFWHPAGHLGEYYVRHGQPEQAVACAELGVRAAASLGAPPMACGMASYNLACAQTAAELLAEAAVTVRAAVALNPDLHANVARDRDLAALRDSGLLAGVGPLTS